MTVYQTFIGIDIGKDSFVVGTHGKKKTWEYENNSSGISEFMQAFVTELHQSFVVLEVTGGYEMELLLSLCQKKIAVHRANTRKVKNFIRSFGHAAKTDQLDAKALSLYGYERHETLECFKPLSSKMVELYSMAQRRQDLRQMLVAEKNRKQAPRAALIQESCQAVIEVLDAEMERLTAAIEELISSDPALADRKKVLKMIAGIGDKISQDLLAFMPELGSMTRRQVASLCGLAPRANDSGRYSGYRKTGYGRTGIKPMLYLSAMAARNSKTHLRTFYEDLVARGKPKKVALTALMRKIIVMANAKVRDYDAGVSIEELA